MSNARLMTRFLLGAAAEGLEAGAASGGSLVRSTCATCSKVRDARQKRIKMRSHATMLFMNGVDWRAGVVEFTSVVSFSEVLV